MLSFRRKVVTDSRQVSVKDRDWTLQVKKVQRRDDGQTMYLIAPVQDRFVQLSSAVLYEEIRKPMWLNQKEICAFIAALQKLAGKGEEENSGGSVNSEASR